MARAEEINIRQQDLAFTNWIADLRALAGPDDWADFSDQAPVRYAIWRDGSSGSRCSVSDPAVS